MLGGVVQRLHRPLLGVGRAREVYGRRGLAGGPWRVEHSGPEYNHLAVPQPHPWDVMGGEAIGFVMWFWIFYRAKEDGVYVLGIKKHWEEEGHHDAHGSHGGSLHKLEWIKEMVGERPVLQTSEDSH